MFRCPDRAWYRMASHGIAVAPGLPRVGSDMLLLNSDKQIEEYLQRFIPACKVRLRHTKCSITCSSSLQQISTL